MEALAAVSLAGNVLQFVQLGLQVLSKGHSLKRSHDKAFKEHVEFEEVIKDLDSRLSRLRLTAEVTNPGLISLVKSCQEVGGNIRETLSKIQSRDSKNIWTSYRQALSAVWHKGEVDEAERRLERLRDEMSFHLLTIIKQDVAELLLQLSSTSSAIGQLKDEARRTGDAILAHHDELTSHAKLFSEIRNVRKLHAQMYDLVQASLSRGQDHWTARKPSHADFLETFRFRGMDDREESIPNAHAETYQWLLMPSKDMGGINPDFLTYSEQRANIRRGISRIFSNIGVNVVTNEDPVSLWAEDRCPSQHLQQWLKSGDGIFWIWGKPGCGKSTMMKSLLQKAPTRKQMNDLLTIWAGDSDLIIASFFFFRPGMSLANSHAGFLRSLLLKILGQRPDKIDQVFTLREQAEAIIRSRLNPESENNVWSIGELQRAFRKWRRSDGSKVLLLVDGIDEVNAPARDVVEMLCDCADRKGVKILAAGRWTPEFEASFDSLQMLALHETTELDILQFTVDRLNQPRLLQILDTPSKQFLSIVQEIQKAAQGVFQWVKIVVDSLLHGVHRFENFEELYGRLKEYPEDLDKLYWFIYREIDSRHIQSAAFWLLCMSIPVKAAKRKSASADRWPNKYRVFPQSPGISVQLGAIEPRKMYLMEKFDLNRTDSLRGLALDWYAEPIRGKNGSQRSRGLGGDRTMKRVQDRMRAQCPHFFEFGRSTTSRVSFAHRTVLDFVSQSQARESLQSHLPPGKDPLMALIAAELATNWISVSDTIEGTVKFYFRSDWVLREVLVRQAPDDVEPVALDRLLRQLGPVLDMAVDDNEKNILRPSLQGWIFQSKTDLLREICEDQNPAVHLLALLDLDLSPLAHIAKRTGLSSAERELVTIERFWDLRTGHYSFQCTQRSCVDSRLRNYFDDLFPEGTTVQGNLGLHLIFDRFQMVFEVEIFATPLSDEERMHRKAETMIARMDGILVLLGHFLRLVLKSTVDYDTIPFRKNSAVQSALYMLEQAASRLFILRDNIEGDRTPHTSSAACNEYTSRRSWNIDSLNKIAKVTADVHKVVRRVSDCHDARVAGTSMDNTTQNLSDPIRFLGHDELCRP